MKYPEIEKVLQWMCRNYDDLSPQELAFLNRFCVDGRAVEADLRGLITSDQVATLLFHTHERDPAAAAQLRSILLA